MSSLEAAITLEDVFTVVEAKRVPLAPELAGYLTLEIADFTDAGSGDVDTKAVFISDEGTVALVRPKRDSVTGEAESSIRRLLEKLLDASGSGTPALTAAAKRKPGHGLPALVEELEAALIPVNRAAGRRALARLVREVKRVLLGVGRNASAAALSKPPTAAERRPAALRKGATAPADASVAAPGERRASHFDDEAATAKRDNELALLASSMLDESGAGTGATPAPSEASSSVESEPDAGPGASRADAQPAPAPARVPAAPLPPPPVRNVSGPAAPAPPPRRPPHAPAVAEVRPEAAAPKLFGGDEVENLLDAFNVSHEHEEKQMSRELKAIAGMSPTPPPPDAKTLAELTKDVGKDLPKKLVPSLDGDSVEALLALTDASAPVAPSRAAARDALAAPDPATNAPPAIHAPPVESADESFAFAPPPPPVREGAPSLRQPTPTRGARAVPRSVTAPTSSAAHARAPEPPAAHAAKQAPSKRRRHSAGEAPRAPKTGMAILVFALLVLAGGTVAVWRFAPQVFTGKKRATPSATAPTAPALPQAPKCKVALVLTDVPTNAEILLRVGRAPGDVERMPVGTRLEFVATAEGHAPRRAVVNAESAWDNGPDGKPRIDVPIQLDPTAAKPGAVDPWPLAEAGSQVGGSGPPGTVHVVSNVRGAEVWLRAGLGPEARIDQLHCDEDIDILFAGPPALRKKLHVSKQEILATPADAQGNKVVNVSAK